MSGQLVEEVKSQSNITYTGSPAGAPPVSGAPIMRPPAFPCKSYNGCKSGMWAVAIIVILAGIVAIIAGSFDLSGVADSQTNGIMAVVAGSVAIIMGFVAAILAWRCVGCKLCSLTPSCNTYE